MQRDRRSSTIEGDAKQEKEPHEAGPEGKRQKTFKDAGTTGAVQTLGNIPGLGGGSSLADEQGHKVQIVNAASGEELCSCTVDKTTQSMDQATVGSLISQIVSAAGIQEEGISLFLPHMDAKLQHATKLADCNWPTTILVLIERVHVVATDAGVEVPKLTNLHLRSWAEHTGPEEVFFVKLAGCRKVTNVSSLTIFTNLQQLDLAECNVDKDSLTAVVLNCKGLSGLDVSSNYLGRHLTAQLDINALADALLRHPAMTSVNILGNSLKAEAAAQFISALDASTTLTTLCGFGGDDTEIDISGGTLSDACFLLIANELEALRSLTSIKYRSTYRGRV